MIQRIESTPTYSDIVIHGTTVYLSGQVPWKTASIGAPFAEQATEVLDLIASKLDRVGSSMQHILSMQVFLPNPADYPEFNRVVQTYIPAAVTPARNTICGVTFPNSSWKLEIVVVAALRPAPLQI